MTDPGVALTDYALAIECALFAALLQRRGAAGELRPWFVLFFASASAAPLFGGTVHGFFLDEQSLGHAWLWPATLLAIGGSALAAWCIGARMLFEARGIRWVTRAAVAQFGLYALAVVGVTQEFRIAMLDYLPAALFLLVAFALAQRRRGGRDLALGVWGLGLAFAAAALQQLRVGVHPVYLNHNVVYHVLQAVALLLIFLAARALVGRAAPRSSPAC